MGEVNGSLKLKGRMAHIKVFSQADLKSVKNLRRVPGLEAVILHDNVCRQGWRA